jgi:hypothetical protein
MFKPFTFGDLILPNRIVMAPMTRGFSPGGVPGSNVTDYYRRRAELPDPLYEKLKRSISDKEQANSNRRLPHAMICKRQPPLNV